MVALNDIIGEGQVLGRVSDAAAAVDVIPAEVLAAPSGGDDTAAIQAKIDALAPGGLLVVPPADYLVTQLIVDKPLTIAGVGADSKLIAHSSASDYLIYVRGGDTPGITQGDGSFLYGVTIRDLFLEGAERGEPAGGIRLRDAQRCRIDNVFIQNFAKSGVYFQRRVRNNFFNDVHIKLCGDHDSGYAHWEIRDTGSGDGHNNNYFSQCESIYPYGSHVLAHSTNTSSATRNHFFTNCMFHGTTPGATLTSYGVEYTADHRNHGVGVRLVNARGFQFTNCRFQGNARGWPMVLAQDVSDISEVNSFSVNNSTWGGIDTYAATFTAAVNDELTFGASHGLDTGALVRVSSTTTLPAGLSAATDYWVIRISDTVVKLASTRLNAEAGTAVDVTGTGTGTHTLTAQQCHVLVESGNGIVGSGNVFEGTINRAHVVDLAAGVVMSDSIRSVSTSYETP